MLGSKRCSTVVLISTCLVGFSFSDSRCSDTECSGIECIDYADYLRVAERVTEWGSVAFVEVVGTYAYVGAGGLRIVDVSERVATTWLYRADLLTCQHLVELASSTSVTHTLRWLLAR